METAPEVLDVVTTTVRTDMVEGAEGEKEVKVLVKPVKVGKERKGEEGRNLQLRPGYMYREGNWEIGRAAERAKVKVRDFVPRDRWTAWRKSGMRKGKNAEKRSLGRKIR